MMLVFYLDQIKTRKKEVSDVAMIDLNDIETKDIIDDNAESKESSNKEQFSDNLFTEDINQLVLDAQKVGTSSNTIYKQLSTSEITAEEANDKIIDAISETTGLSDDIMDKMRENKALPPMESQSLLYETTSYLTGVPLEEFYTLDNSEQDLSELNGRFTTNDIPVEENLQSIKQTEEAEEDIQSKPLGYEIIPDEPQNNDITESNLEDTEPPKEDKDSIEISNFESMHITDVKVEESLLDRLNNTQESSSNTPNTSTSRSSYNPASTFIDFEEVDLETEGNDTTSNNANHNIEDVKNNIDDKEDTEQQSALIMVEPVVEDIESESVNSSTEPLVEQPTEELQEPTEELQEQSIEELENQSLQELENQSLEEQPIEEPQVEELQSEPQEQLSQPSGDTDDALQSKSLLQSPQTNNTHFIDTSEPTIEINNLDNLTNEPNSDNPTKVSEMYIQEEEEDEDDEPLGIVEDIPKVIKKDNSYKGEGVYSLRNDAESEF